MYRKFLYSLLVLAVLGTFFFINSCQKVDNSYRNYATSAAEYKGSIYQYLQAQRAGFYDSLLLAVNRISSLRTLLQNDTVTLFAPTNASFTLALANINQARADMIPAKKPVSIATMDSAVLDTVLTKYILVGRKTSDSVRGYTDGLFFKTVKYGYNMHLQLEQSDASGFVNGGPISLEYSDPKKSVFVINWSRTTTITVNIRTSNGYLHILSPGHDFGFGNEFIRSVNRY